MCTYILYTHACAHKVTSMKSTYPALRYNNQNSCGFDAGLGRLVLDDGILRCMALP